MSYENSLKYSVDRFGAKGDGTTDDTAAITAAINAAISGSTVLFTPGKTYKTVSAITIGTDNVTLMGYGAIITSDTQAHYQKFIFNGRNRGAVLGLRFNCIYTSGTGGNGTGVIHINSSSDVNVRDCDFNDVLGDCVAVLANSNRCSVQDSRMTNFFVGVYGDDDTVNPVRALIVTGNKFFSGLTGSFTGCVKISGMGSTTTSAKHVIANNYMESGSEMGIELHTWVNDCVVSNNVIVGTVFGISIAQDSSRVCVNGNIIRECSYIAVEFAKAHDCTASANTIHDSTKTHAGFSLSASPTNINLTGNTISGCSYQILVADTAGLSITNNLLSNNGTSEMVYIKNVTDFAITSNEFLGGATTYGFIGLDSSNSDVSYGLINSNVFRGSITNNGLLYYSPANHITDIHVHSNSTVHCSCPGGGISVQTPGGNAADRLLRLRHRNNINGGNDNSNAFNFPVVNVSASMPFGGTDFWWYFGYDEGLVTCNASGAAQTHVLPSAVGLLGFVITFSKADSGGNSVTIDGQGSETINGATTFVLATQYKRVTIISNGTNWDVMQSN